MLANQILQTFYRFGFGNVELHRRLADVQIHLARRAADIPEIGVRHFARAIHDATHDRDLHAFEMRSCLFDSSSRCLEIEQGAAAGRAGDVIGFENARAGCLQNIVTQAQSLPRRFFSLNQDRVTDAIAEERANVRRGVEKSF